MKVIVTHKSNSISFEIEKNLPEHEAFEVLRAFTVSAFEELPDPLVYSLAGGEESFRLQDPKDWKEGLQKHFQRSVICLNVVEPATDSDGESDSYVLLTQDGSEKTAVQLPAAAVEEEVSTYIEDEKADEDEEPVIEDHEEDLEDKPVDQEEPAQAEEEDTSPASMKRRIMQFIVEIGSEAVQNIVAVVHSLVSEGADLGDAIRTAMETSEKAANHPLTKDLLAIVDVYVQKFNNQCNWQPMLAHFNVDHIVALIPGIVDALTRSLEGADRVELDMSPLISQFCPMLRGLCQNIPNGEERVFQANPLNPFAVFQEARQTLQAEAEANENRAVHRGITCDGCEMSPIVGVRYKSTLRSDYDLCEECEKTHDPADPLIKIKVPLDSMDLLPGLGEFRRAAVGGPRHRGHPCRFRRGRGRGCRGRGRGACMGRRRGGCGMMKKMFEQMKQHCEAKKAECGQMPWCTREYRRDPARDQVAQKKEELRSKKAELEEKKKEMKQKQKEMKEQKKELKSMKKEVRKLKKEAKAVKMTEIPYASVVVGHLDSEETSVQKAGSSVLHQWKVKNIGTEKWTGQVLAVLAQQSEGLVADGFELLDVGEVKPGHVCYLPVMLNVPTAPGPYQATYRMTTADGTRFGEPLNVYIEVPKGFQEAPPAYESVASSPTAPLAAVPGSIPQTINDEPALRYDVPEFVEPEAEEVEEEVQPAPTEPFAFASQLQQLQAMGFQNDEETLKSVLVVTNGDIAQAISALM